MPELTAIDATIEHIGPLSKADSWSGENINHVEVLRGASACRESVSTAWLKKIFESSVCLFGARLELAAAGKAIVKVLK